MTSGRQSVTQKDPRQAELAQLAARLGQLMEVDFSADDVVDAVRSAAQIEHNKKVLLKFQREVFNGHDWSTETLARNLTEDFVDHAAMPGDPPGFEGVQMRFSGWAAAFEGAEEDNLSMVGEGDLIGVMYNLHARHTGEFMGIEPTNRDVVIPGMEIVRIRDNKIAEHWGIYDFLRTAEEIGADLTFVKRGVAEADPRRPVAPWAQQMTEEDAKQVGEDAENYIRRDG
jgi:predicted SnoaL-like aldol condensation-catalyzing enzyme